MTRSPGFPGMEQSPDNLNSVRGSCKTPRLLCAESAPLVIPESDEFPTQWENAHKRLSKPDQIGSCLRGGGGGGGTAAGSYRPGATLQDRLRHSKRMVPITAGCAGGDRSWEHPTWATVSVC